MVTLAALKKSMKDLDAKISTLSKGVEMIDGAVVTDVKQLSTKPGSGHGSFETPKHNPAEGKFVTGSDKEKIERDIEAKAGSGADVPEEYANTTHQTGTYFQDGTKDKEKKMGISKADASVHGAKSKPMKAKGGKGAKGGKAVDAKRAGIPAPKKQGKK